MKELIESFALSNNFQVDYGTAAFQNLHNSESQGIHLFIDPIKVQDNLDPDYGTTLSKTYSGSFLMVRPSNLSELYPFRYTNYIEPCKTAYEAFKEFLRCEGSLTLNSLGYIEIVNSPSLSLSCDGLLITYSVTQIG